MCLRYRGFKFWLFSHANSQRLSLVHWRWWPIVSEFVFSQRQQSLSASMHGNNNLFDLNDGGVSQVTRMCDVYENYVYVMCRIVQGDYRL